MLLAISVTKLGRAARVWPRSVENMCALRAKLIKSEHATCENHWRKLTYPSCSWFTHMHLKQISIKYKSWKSRNLLTLLKEINKNICIISKRSYYLKYWSYDIINMRKRIFSNFYIFPLFFIFFGWEILNFWKIQNRENLEILKTNLKISLKFEIWKSQFCL